MEKSANGSVSDSLPAKTGSVNHHSAETLSIVRTPWSRE